MRVAGLLFLVDDARARSSILACMRAGDVVERFGGSLVVRHARVERAESATLAGLALVDEAGVLSSAPLSRAELARAKELPGHVAIVRGGALSVERAEARVDPAGWIDVSELVLEAPVSLGVPPPRLASAPVARAAREALGVAPLSHESEALRRAILGPNDLRGARVVGGTGPASGFFARLASRLVGSVADGVASMVSLLRRVLGGSEAQTAPALPPNATSPAKSTALAPTAPRPPGLLARLDAWLRDRMRRLGWRGFGSFLVRKHAEHLQKLLELLEGQDLDEALRHAIPLSNEAGGGAAGAPSLSPPSPRTELAISPHRAKGGGALGLDGGLFEHLRQRYRALYQRLLTLERWKDAAFVLAELLDDALGAVALLEKHGFHREAAELAEGRALAPAIQVRQWLLARDLPRAVLIAQRHDAFGPAITRMRTSDREAARALALAWADLRARGGDYLGAIAALEAGDALASARGLAVRWADRGVDAGGVLGAEALVWLLVLDGDALTRVGPRLDPLLRDDSADTRHVRHAVYAAMARHRSASAAPLFDAARFAWRAAVRDRALFGEPTLSQLSELESLSRDRTLGADRPTIVPLSRTKLDRLAAPLVVGPSSVGAFEVLDAVVLPDRRVLVALGEAGLRVLAPDGRAIASFDVPTDALVLSDEGTRALSVTKRGSLSVVHRVDTAQRRVGDRFEIFGLESFARTFDGERWAVSLEGVGQVLDVSEDTPRSLFRVRDVRVIEVDRSPGFVSFIASSGPMPSAPSGLERLRYEEKGLVLRERRALPERFGMEGRLLGIARFEPEPVHLMMTHGSYYVSEGLTGYPGSRERHGRPKGPDSLTIGPRWMALVVEHLSPVRDELRAVTDVVVLDRTEQRERLIVPIDDGTGAPVSRLSARLETRRGEPPLLVVCDARGRVIAIELDEGRVVVDVGVR